MSIANQFHLEKYRLLQYLRRGLSHVEELGHVGSGEAQLPLLIEPLDGNPRTHSHGAKMDGQRPFPRDQYLILNHLATLSEECEYETIGMVLHLDQVFVSAALQTLEAADLVRTRTTVLNEISLGKSGEELPDERLPERRIIEVLANAPVGKDIPGIAALSGLDQKLIGQSIKILRDKNWAENRGGQIYLSEKGMTALNERGDDEKLFALVYAKGPIVCEELVSDFPFIPSGLNLLKQRSNLIKVRERKKRRAILSEKGMDLVAKGIAERIEATALHPDHLREGKWRDISFKPYNVTDAVDPLHPGKCHPFHRVLDETRRTFLEMGFSEVSSPFVESSFWDFDALFQPQDHPARDMQDTFYIKEPSRSRLPPADLVERVKNTHENGGQTGSLGWRYHFDMDLAERNVLRTHTTAASIRALSKQPHPPLRVFCIGRVFRRETIDYKHLPVFYQVDGIIVDRQASLSNLIWLLSEFYRKMGFERIDVRPSFFPYTEPSLEVFVYLKKKGDWVEMGGAGIFRPEVTEPLGCTDPVLAFGLGLERLAMFRYELADIREIYMANITWLREVALCRS